MSLVNMNSQGIPTLSNIPPLETLHTNVKNRIGEVLKNKVIFFIGYPGSGKGTQGKKMDELNIRHLSTGELFRAEVKKGTDIGKKMGAFMETGQIIPKEITFEYLTKELSKSEYRNGFILDGYPKNLESFEFIMKTLKELKLQPLAALHFDLSRGEVVKRLTGRLHCNDCEHDFHIVFLPPKKENECDNCHGHLEQRPDDSISAIQTRLDSFDKSTMPVVEEFKKRALLCRMEAVNKPTEVYDSIVSTILGMGGSYHLRNPKVENSATFHNHIDAKTHTLLRTIVDKVESVNTRFQNKLYPVSHLQLGPQTTDKEFSTVYDCLPNFHPIHNATDEAFSTGKMGEEGFNYAQIRRTLEVASMYPNQGVMTELEEDIYSKEFDADGKVVSEIVRGNTPYKLDWNQLPGLYEKQICNVPRFELHHGFDIPKNVGETTPPIDLTALSNMTTQNGFQTGGWFIFRKDTMWSYRSNEFTNEAYEPSLNKLNEQAILLRNIVSKFLPNRTLTNSCAMEKVHAMWRI